MAYIKNKTQLVEYIKRKLTHSDIDIEVEEPQYDDIIADALQMFCSKAYDGVQERYYLLGLENDKREYRLNQLLNKNISAVLEVLDGTGFVNMFGSNLIVREAMANAHSSGTGIGLLDIELINQYVQNLDSLLTIKRSFNYNTTSKVLYLDDHINFDKTVMIHCYEELDTGDDSNDHNNIYDHKFVKNYASALARLQWADNLSKYSGSVLPNGLTLNTDKMYERAERDIEKWEQILTDEFEAPLDFFVG